MMILMLQSSSGFVKSLETVNLTEVSSMLNNEQFKLLALALDAQTSKTTIKHTIVMSSRRTD